MTETDLIERIAIVQRTRETAAAALAETLRSSQEGSSERDICDRWLQTISEATSLCPEGWYQPPPGGACVLIGHPEDRFVRLNYDSLRNTTTWSRSDILLRNDSLIYAYASPFDYGTGLIGDIGLTLYRGAEQPIRDYLSACLDVTTSIACFAEVGMELRELFNYAQRQLEAISLKNQASSTASGMANIGHTVPWSYEGYSEQAKQVLDRRDPREIRDVISSHRVSINNSATLRIQPTMAFTVEPQIASPTDPLCSYHVIVTFSEGNKRVLSLFDDLFKYFEMGSYMHAALARLA